MKFLSNPIIGFKRTCYLAILGAAISSTPSMAFDELNEAQQLLFDKAHLTSTESGQSITYSYQSNLNTKTVDDTVTLNITAQVDEERRDVDLDFLSDERHMPLPPFNAYRGNPIIMAMLEHMVQNIAQNTGGGALYFRNRVRDSLASEDISVDSKKIKTDSGELDATVVTFQPLKNDPRLGADSIYSKAIFTISLSDKVPGTIIDMSVKAEAEGQPEYSQALTFIR